MMKQKRTVELVKKYKYFGEIAFAFALLIFMVSRESINYTKWLLSSKEAKKIVAKYKKIGNKIRLYNVFNEIINIIPDYAKFDDENVSHQIYPYGFSLRVKLKYDGKESITDIAPEHYDFLSQAFTGTV